MQRTASANSLPYHSLDIEQAAKIFVHALTFVFLLFVFIGVHAPAAIAMGGQKIPSQQGSMVPDAPRNVTVSRDGSYAIIIEAGSNRLWKLALNRENARPLTLFADNLPAEPLCIERTENGYRIYGPLRSDISKWILGPAMQARPMIAIDIDTEGRFLRARRYVRAGAVTMPSP